MPSPRWMLLGLCFVVALPAHAADPFYDRLYHEGQSLLAADPAKAARKLQLACFGLLEEPTTLAGCLGRLALAQAQIPGDKNHAALKSTLDQLLDLERRFQATSKMLGAWSPADRERLERILSSHSSYAVLVELPAFRLQAIRALPPEERRRELDRRQAGDPRNPDWRLLAAELFFELRQYAEAVREAQHLIELRPNFEAGRCLRGAAQASLGECGDTTLEDLALCRDPRMDPAQLRCLIQRQDLVLARSLLERLAPEQRSSPEGQALEKELVRLEKKAGLSG